MTKETELTIWGAPTIKFDSQYGKIHFGDWLKKEQERFAKDGVKTAIITNKEQMLCLVKE